MVTINADKVKTASERLAATFPHLKGWRAKLARWLTLRPVPTQAQNSYRYLARQIEADLPCVEGGRIIVLTSLGPLALSNETLLVFSYFMRDELGSRILLIDGTFRDDGVGSRLGHRDAPGFLDLVYGHESSVADLIRPTERGGIAVLPAGRMSQHKITPLQTNRVVEILHELANSYDYLLFQQASILDDSRYLRCTVGADLILLLVEEGVTLADELERCKRVFRDHQISNVRLVLSASTG